MNLFNVTPHFKDRLGTKPRCANDAEIKAYLIWQRDRRCLPALELGEVVNGWYSRGTAPRIKGATFGRVIEEARWNNDARTHHPAQYEDGAYSVLMPGANQRAVVTMETLDDAGEVVASSTLPVEPKKSGIVWTREQVRKAAGPVARPMATAKPKRAASGEAERVRAELAEVRAELAEARAELAIALFKRRRAIRLARDFQQRLYAEYRMVDRLQQQRRIFRDAAEQAIDQRIELQRLLREAGQVDAGERLAA